jgi:hypothetical protein
VLRALLVFQSVCLLMAGAAFGDPGVSVDYVAGVPRIQLGGSYPQSYYTVWRATSSEGAFEAISDLHTLCLEACYVDDTGALPGKTYWYRFDILLADGSFVSYGPYSVAISSILAARVAASVSPNPIRVAARVDLFLAGTSSDPALPVEAALYDLQGRKVHVFFRGMMGRGTTTLGWDGKARSGQGVVPGRYFLRFSSPLGTSITPVIRTR